MPPFDLFHLFFLPLIFNGIISSPEKHFFVCHFALEVEQSATKGFRERKLEVKSAIRL